MNDDEARLGRRLPDWTPPPRPGFEALAGRHVRLEPLSAEAHTADLYAAFAADDRVWEYLGYGPFDSETAYGDWVRSVQGGADPMFLAVVDRSTGRAVGVLSWLRIDAANGVIEVGHINFSPMLQRTPAATEAIWLGMSRVFELGYRRYEWKCNALNLPSRRAAERFGFSYEGLFRQAIVTKGRNRDTAWFAMTDEDFARLSPLYARWLADENFDADGRQKVSLSDLTRPVLVAADPMRDAPRT